MSRRARRLAGPGERGFSFDAAQLENWVGIDGSIWAPVVVFLLLAALPFLDRSKEQRPRRRKWVMASALVLFGVLSVLTLMVAFSGPAAHLG